MKTAEALRNEGIERAVNHADAVCEDWSGKACEVAKLFIEGINPSDEFMMEDIREFATKNNLLPPPPDNRAWAGVASYIKKNNLACFSHWGAVKSPSSHGRPGSVYKKL